MFSLLLSKLITWCVVFTVILDNVGKFMTNDTRETDIA